MFWLSTLDTGNSDAFDSDNGKINYHYADLIEKEKFLLQNLSKSTKIEPKTKTGKSSKYKQGKKWKKEYYSKNRGEKGIVRPLYIHTLNIYILKTSRKQKWHK